MDYILDNEEKTFALAKKIAANLKGGDILALYGDLGAGKTTFVKGLGKALGITSQITSPTFVVLKEYQIENGKDTSKINSIHRVVHVDCYRFTGIEDANSIGLAEYFGKKDSILVVEWPEKIEEILPKSTKKLFFTYIDEKSRKITSDEI